MKGPLSYIESNAAKKETYVGNYLEEGTKFFKKKLEHELNGNFMELHLKGYIHIDAF
ncbi:hypothetical protein [Liquorilactobacillus satsumensis]|uniref:hypothetical protein n=1 Tax=Liquorilactobacillus satsumensis TaxID=259059 RepID=UPI0039EA7ABD